MLYLYIKLINFYMQETQSTYGNSGFWLSDRGWLRPSDNKTETVLKLIAAKKSISNFVKIVTGENIPVNYVTRGDSKTDGKRIQISSNIVNPGDFDVTVGLALHEAAHIKLSDFNLLKGLSTEITKRLRGSLPTYSHKASSIGIDLTDFTKDILNWVEDRRIDSLIYDSAPGYQDYYHAMYGKFFNFDWINKALVSANFRDESVESYTMRIINLHSDLADLGALKGLKQIWDLVDLGRINRLTSTKESLDLAVEIVKIVLDNAVSNKSDKKPKQENKKPQSTDSDNDKSESGESQPDNSESDEDETGSDDSESDNEQDNDKSDDTQSNETGDDKSESDNGQGDDKSESDNGQGDDKSNDTQSNEIGNGKGNQPKPELKENEINKAIESLKKQLIFGEGNIKKEDISISLTKEIQVIDAGDVTLTDSNFAGQAVSTIFIKRLTDEILKSSIFPLVVRENPALLSAGIGAGRVLAKKLLVRGETKNTIFTRQATGKIDKRLVAQLGFNSATFYRTEIDQYKAATLHLSIDGSSSMGGRKWKKTLTLAIALAVAVKEIPNLDLQISVRTTTSDKPCVVIVWDSKHDTSLLALKRLSSLLPQGTTPEGLCFAAIQKVLTPGSAACDSYFVNISDGEPYFNGSTFNYSGSRAAKHTFEATGKISADGIKVLSYYVSSTDGDQCSDSYKCFKQCYGPAASFVNIDNITEIQKTLNRLFMTK